MAKDFKSEENLKRLIKAANDLKDKEGLDKFVKKAIKSTSRTSSRAGKGFKLIGGVKNISGKVNFTRPIGGALTKIASKPLAKIAAKKGISKALTTIGSKAISNLPKVAVRGSKLAGLAIGGPLVALGMEAFDAEPLGAGSDNVPHMTKEQADIIKNGQAFPSDILNREMQIKQRKIQSAVVANSEEGRQLKSEMIETAPITKARKTELKKANVNASINNAEIAREQNKSASPKDNFLSTLAMFIPSIIGGIGGALVGGAEGAAAGLEGGLKGAKVGLDLVQSVKNVETTNLKQQILQNKLNGADSASKKDILGKVFNIKGGASRGQKASAVKTILPNGQATLVFKDENGNTIPSKFVNKTSEDSINIKKIIADDRLAENRNRRRDQVFKTFTGSRVKGEIEALKQLDSLDDLLQSKTKIVGLIDFKMAKGIAQEVGNLAEGERAAASQFIGIPGLFNKTEEFITGKLSGRRKEEIEKLAKFMRGNIQGRIKGEADKFSRSKQNIAGVKSAAELKELLLLNTGVDFNKQPKAKFIKRKTKDGRIAIFDENKKFVRYE